MAVLDATTGIPSMIGDVHTIFFSNASPLDKVMAGADLLLNVGMDAAMVVGVGEGLRVAYVGVHVAEHVAEDVGAHAIEHAGEDAVAHTVEHEAESEAEHAGEQAAEDGAEAGGCLSFAAGTLVATPTGETPIAALKAGDHVTAYDPATGTASTQTVTATSIHHDDNLVDLTLRVSGPATPAAVSSATASRTTPATPATPATAGKAASQATAATSQNTVSGTHHEVIHTTTNHPWLTGDHGWLPASFLRVGEPVVQLDGTTATVATIHVVPGAASMWDLTVSNLHTFAVGTGKYIVHNNMCPVKSRIHEDPELVKHAERAGSDPKVQRDMDNLIRRYREGNPNPGLENGSLFKDVRYLRARSGARVFFRMAGDTMEVLGKASKANETRVIRIMQMMYGR